VEATFWWGAFLGASISEIGGIFHFARLDSKPWHADTAIRRSKPTEKVYKLFDSGEIFYSLKELRVLAERWRVHYNTVRPHSSLSSKAPAPRYSNNRTGTKHRADQRAGLVSAYHAGHADTCCMIRAASTRRKNSRRASAAQRTGTAPSARRNAVARMARH